MGAHEAGVDRDLPIQLVNRLGDHSGPLDQRGEGAVARPAPESVADGLSRPVPLGQVPPGDAGLGLVQHSVDHPAVIDPGTPLGPRRRQQRLDDLPLLIGQLMPTHHKAKIKPDQPDLL